MTSIKVLVLSGTYLPGYKGGGPIKTIKNLIHQTSDLISYKIITSDRDLGNTTPYLNIHHGIWNNLGNSEAFYIEPGIKGIYQLYVLTIKTDYDILYLNSFFSPKFSLLPLIISKLTKKQVVLGPRGEFSEGALKLKTTKKNIFIKVYKLLNLSNGVVFQASSKYEAEDIRRILGSEIDIFIAEDIGSQDFAKVIPLRNKVFKAIFISRISPMKNLHLALEILKKLRNPLIYDIYGPIEDESYWLKCQNIISKLPSHITVQYKGELTPDQVVPTLSLYDFFFMPTEGENYGHVIAEALCAGLPLIISNTTPWKDLEKLGIGWDISLNNLYKFSTVIDQLSELSVDEHRKMRESVLAWAKHKFAQRDAISANIAMFRYVSNKNKGINNAI